MLVAAASTDEGPALNSVARRAQGAMVMGGHVGNGHALEAAYRLSELSEAPVTLVLDAESGAPMAGAPREEEEPVEA
ncbi:hypothetical protein D3C87_2019030 [compost metagenome]